VRPLYRSVSVEKLQELVSRAVSRDPTYRPPNFFTYFVVECPSRVRAASVAEVLRAWDSVDMAYVAPRTSPPVTLDDSQPFHDPAPGGIDSPAAWAFAGGDGAGQRLVDLEGGWTLDHDELGLDGVSDHLDGGGINDSWRAHGTAVLGIIRAINNGVGPVGIAPAAQLDLISNATPAGDIDDALIPGAIVAALAELAFGQVLLIELQIEGQINGVATYLPIEADPTFFAPIRLATALGIVVVEAAGSHTADLDAFVNDKGQQVFNEASADYQDSVAIMVGAATSAVPHQHHPAQSSIGRRIDAYGWGENIMTCSSDSSASTTAIEYNFGGTSGAAAMVAGAVLVIQGLQDQVPAPRFSPAAMRALLRDPANHTSVTGRYADRGIPNLGAVISGALNVAPDVYVRDYLGDTGDPDGISRALSPDIIVRNAATNNPEAAYGAGSGTENNDGLSENVLAGQDNYVYVRLLNRGGNDAAGVTATVYWAEPATLITPDAWNLIGTSAAVDVPVGNQLTVAGPITWQAANVPRAGHYCFIAVAGNDKDPAPVAQQFVAWPAQAWDYFTRFINVNNNAAWRNFNVVTPRLEGDELEADLDFIMRGAFDRARPMALEVVALLPKGARIALSTLRLLPDRWRVLLPFVERREDRSLILLQPRGRVRFPLVTLAKGEKRRLRIHVRIPAEARRGAFDVYARQLHGGIELGRVTWRIQTRRAERHLNRE
jgi:hypothetical protein